MKSSWNKIENHLLEYYENGKEIPESSRDFLERINFIKSDSITPLGEDYLDSKFIYEDGRHTEILRREVLNLQEVRELCQAFYGQKTERRKVERFLKSKTEVTNNKQVGRILNLLNTLDIVSYSKRTGGVQFSEAEQVDEESQDSYRITNRTPYSNVKRLRNTIRSCEGDLMWVAKHFPKKGLEPLSDELTGNKFSSVQILCGPDNVTHKMRSDFERFKEEMDNRGIKAELRVMTNKEHLGNLHDRWILSDENSYNVPPVNSLYRNQEAEIHKTTDKIPFEKWWSEAENIISDWNEIQKYI